MKKLCWRCPECWTEYTDLYNSDELAEMTKNGSEPRCPDCDEPMIPWNVKSNLQRWRYADK